MILALLREEFDCAQKLGGIARFQRGEEGVVAQFSVEKGRLSRQFGRRMGVGVGDECVAIQPGEPPIHGRVGRKAGFQGEDVWGQVAETFLHRIEAGFGAEHRKPGGPDVGGDEVAPGVVFEDNLQQVPAVQAQDGAAIGPDVADALQPGL